MMIESELGLWEFQTACLWVLEQFKVSTFVFLPTT